MYTLYLGIVQASANSTLDQTRLYSAKVHDVYRSFPETDSIFQITFPTGGFSEMVTKPVERAEEDHGAAPDRGRAEAGGHPRRTRDPHDAGGGPARGRRLPRGLREITRCRCVV